MNKERRTTDHREPIRDYLNELWVKYWEYPLQWSLDLSKLDGPLGEEHRNRLKGFNRLLENNLRNGIDLPKKK